MYSRLTAQIAVITIHSDILVFQDKCSKVEKRENVEDRNMKGPRRGDEIQRNLCTAYKNETLCITFSLCLMLGSNRRPPGPTLIPILFCEAVLLITNRCHFESACVQMYVYKARKASLTGADNRDLVRTISPLLSAMSCEQTLRSCCSTETQDAPEREREEKNTATETKDVSEVRKRDGKRIRR